MDGYEMMLQVDASCVVTGSFIKIEHQLTLDITSIMCSFSKLE